MQSAYRPTLALVFFGNEMKPSAVGLDVRFWFQAMTFMLDCFHGVVNTEAVMMALAPKMGRGKAHDRLTTISIVVSRGKGQLIDLLSNDPEIAKFLDHTAIERLIEPTNYIGNSGALVDRVLAGRGE
jgi:3-carboxy-cis,cis-muconate cycloisomerase